MEISSAIQRNGLGDIFGLSNVIHFIYRPHEKEDQVKKIMLHTNDKVIVVDLDEVVFLVAVRGYCEILTTSGKRYVSAKSLSEYEELLGPIPWMVRVNKSYLINVNQISSYTKGTSCSITMRGSEQEIEISRRKKRDVIGLLRPERAGKKDGSPAKQAVAENN
jgi:DNA-binding LytR/AlgR family response regulator